MLAELCESSDSSVFALSEGFTRHESAQWASDTAKPVARPKRITIEISGGRCVDSASCLLTALSQDPNLSGIIVGI